MNTCLQTASSSHAVQGMSVGLQQLRGANNCTLDEPNLRIDYGAAFQTEQILFPHHLWRQNQRLHVAQQLSLGDGLGKRCKNRQNNDYPNRSQYEERLDAFLS